MYKHSYPVIVYSNNTQVHKYSCFYYCVSLNVCIADCKIKSSAPIYLFATICWIHVHVYFKTFKFVEKKLVEKKNIQNCLINQKCCDPPAVPPQMFH